MPANEKDEKGLWDKCSQRFNKKLVIGEGDFAGFVLKDVDLVGRHIEHDLDFSGASFIGPARFSKEKRDRTRFTCEVYFNEATFQDDLEMSGARFKGHFDLSGAIVHGRLRLHGAGFAATAVFDGLRCLQDADLSEVVFHEPASFEEVRFEGNGNFRSVSFDKGGSFDRADLKTADFEDAAIQNVSFRQVALDHVRFAGARMENAYLSDSWWSVAPDRTFTQKLLDTLSVADPRFVIREEEEADRIPAANIKDRIRALLRAESTYRRLKHTHTNEGDYNKAGEFYIHEMRMKNSRYRLQNGLAAKWELFWNSFFNISCGYGERPKRLILNAVLIILLFAGLFHAFDGVGKSNDADFDNYEPSARECLYFSVVTFTTLGYGDYSPKPDFQLLITIEAFTGAFTIALSVLVFGRKVMR